MHHVLYVYIGVFINCNFIYYKAKKILLSETDSDPELHDLHDVIINLHFVHRRGREAVGCGRAAVQHAALWQRARSQCRTPVGAHGERH